MEIIIDLNPFTGPFVMISSWNIFSITTDRDIWMTTSFLTTRRLTSFFLFSIFCLFFTSWRDCGFPFSLSLENFTITTLKYQPMNLSHESQLKLNKNKIELWLCLISATRRWNSSSSFLTLNTMFHAQKFRTTLSTLVKFLKTYFLESIWIAASCSRRSLCDTSEAPKNILPVVFVEFFLDRIKMFVN